MCPPTERDPESPAPYGSVPRGPEPQRGDPSVDPGAVTGSSPSTDPGHAADPYEALYRPAAEGPARNPRPLGQYQQTVSAPEEEQADDRYGWLYRPEPAEKPMPAPPEYRYGNVDPHGLPAPEISDPPLWDVASADSPPADPLAGEPAWGAPAPVAPASVAPTSGRTGPDDQSWVGATDDPAGRPAPAPDEPVPSESAAPQKRRRRAPLVITLLVVAALLGITAGVLAPMLLDEGTASGRAGDAKSGATAPKPSEAPFAGKVDKVLPGSATADCQAPQAQDDAGNPVTYAPGQVFDGDKSTAWRCDGSAEGESVSFTFPADTTVAEVGFINGYTKTDPKTEADRYPEYRRVLEATWTFPDGTSYRQQLKDGDERMQKLRIPATEATGVTLTINAVTDPGQSDPTRDAVLISEVRFATPE